MPRLTTLAESARRGETGTTNLPDCSLKAQLEVPKLLGGGAERDVSRDYARRS